MSEQQQQQSHPQSPAPAQQSSSSSTESPCASHCPSTPISAHVSTTSVTTSTVVSSTRQNGHPTSTGGEVSTTVTLPQTSHTTTQGSYRAQCLNASTEQRQCGSHLSSTSALAASSPQPSPSSSQREDSRVNPESLSVSGQQHGYPPTTTSSPQLRAPTNSSPVTRHISGTMTTVQQHDVSLSGQITAMAISPHTQLPPNSSRSTTTASQSSYTASPGAMRTAQQHGYVPSPSTSQMSQQHGHPPPPLSTYQSSSQPTSVSTQCVTSQQSYAASPDASTVQHHSHHSTPPSAASHVRPTFPPHAQLPTSNFAYSGTSQQRAPHTNPGTTAMTFRQHGHAPPPAASQFTTVPSRIPPNSFQHSTTSYSAPRGSTGQHHAIPGYPSSHPYVPSQHASPLRMQPTGAGYSSLSSNFSSQAVHGSLASSTGSSYQSMGSSPYPSYRPPAAVYGQQQHMVSRIPSTHRPTNSGKIFILYCKDPQLHQTFSDDVLDLADILNHCGGFTCTVDHYVSVPPDNWNIWTQQRIEESHYVILVCSPTLAQVLRDPANYMLEMAKGKYYVSTVVNFIQPQKVIPVYLNYCVPQAYLDWVPTQLHTSAVYSLNIAELRSALVVSEDSPRHVLDEKLRVALSEERFRNITKLVNHLRGETATSPPVPPEHPIPIPTVGPGGIPPFPSYPLTSPTRQGLHENIPSSVFEKIAERMPRDWFTLGVKLGVESTRLQKLRTKHSFNHVPAALEMFGLWQQTKGKLATRKALKNVLVKMEYGRLAFELFPDVKN